MKLNLIYNPGAGFGDFDINSVIVQLEQAGYRVNPISTDEKNYKDEIIKKGDSDVIVVVGGDGTMGKVLKLLPSKDIPIGLIPLGTANNIATTLGISDKTDKLVSSWKLSNQKKISVGVVKLPSGSLRFIESVGLGIFTNLMKITDNDNEKNKIQQFKEIAEKLDYALHTLKKSIDEYKPIYCEIDIDGESYNGEYLLVEVMNIPYIGPNLHLAPAADPGDGVLDVVFIKESERQLFQDYLTKKLQREETMMPLKRVKGRNIKINALLSEVHIDDKVIREEKKSKIEIRLDKNELSFFA